MAPSTEIVNVGLLVKVKSREIMAPQRKTNSLIKSCFQVEMLTTIIVPMSHLNPLLASQATDSQQQEPPSLPNARKTTGRQHV